MSGYKTNKTAFRCKPHMIAYKQLIHTSKILESVESRHLGYYGVVILTLSVQEIDSINAVITMKEVWALNEFGTESDQNFYLLY